MIHQVKISQYNLDRLTELQNLQYRLLDLAVREPILTASRQGIIGNVEQDLTQFFGRPSSEAANWITAKQDIILGNLNIFANYANQENKQSFIDDLRHDIDLLNNPRQDKFRVVFSKKSMPAWKKAVGSYLEAFYTLLGKQDARNKPNYGFPSYFFRENLVDVQGERVTAYSRWDFIDYFSEDNKSLYLCAICDATAYRATINHRAYTSIEHFFPKSLYPHLAIHPKNLLPICTFCNSGRHLATDPLKYCSQELGITEILLPYQNDGLRDLAYIQVKMRSRRQTQNIRHPLNIKIKPNRGEASQVYIDRFEQTYGIENSWNQDINQIDIHVYKRITQFLLIDVQLGNDLKNLEFLINRLELLMAFTSMENLGVDPFGYATVWMIKYHIDQIKTKKTASPIFISLTDWANNQQNKLEGYKKHVQELYGRIQ